MNNRLRTISISGLVFSAGMVSLVHASPGFEFFKSQIESMCEDKAVLSCLKASDRQCQQVAKIIISDCGPIIQQAGNREDDETEQRFEGCLSTTIQKGFNVTESDLDRCEEASEDRYNSADQDENLEQINKDIAQAFLNNSHRIDTSNVTMPIYPGVKPVSTTEMFGMEKKGAIPAMIAFSKDAPGSVLGYYKKELTTFKLYEVEGGWLFLETGPDRKLREEMLEAVTLSTKMPHVWITKAEDVEGYKTHIQIGYRPKSK